jgi:hypothetical protein
MRPKHNEIDAFVLSKLQYLSDRQTRQIVMLESNIGNGRNRFDKSLTDLVSFVAPRSVVIISWLGRRNRRDADINDAVNVHDVQSSVRVAGQARSEVKRRVAALREISGYENALDIHGGLPPWAEHGWPFDEFKCKPNAVRPITIVPKNSLDFAAASENDRARSHKCAGWRASVAAVGQSLTPNPAADAFNA